MVYVLNINGQPLMPTDRYGKVRYLLKNKLAKVVKRCPFTIQLLYKSNNYTQPITLGVDAGSKYIGLSASTKEKELYSGEVQLRTDIVDLLSAKRAFRRSRRNRKTRYRECRFNNRIKTKNKGWLAPSITNKINTHLKVVADLHKILPITKIIVEVAAFDMQLLKAKEENLPIPKGIDYQQGDLYNSNLRQYIFFRDHYTCQWCKGKSKSKILHTHHHAYWKGIHSNKPKDLITLCDVCNDSKNHKPEAKKLWGWNPIITKTYKDAVFMGIMRWSFYNKLKSLYPNVSLTYGYITKNNRIIHNLPKEHRIDAYCITGNFKAKPIDNYYYQKKVRCHNRQIHKATIGKGGYRKLNQSPYIVKGFRLFDKVKYKNKEAFIFGRRATGYFDIRLLDGTKISNSINCKKLKLLEKRKTVLIERRSVVPTTTKVVGFPTQEIS